MKEPIPPGGQYKAIEEIDSRIDHCEEVLRKIEQGELYKDFDPQGLGVQNIKRLFQMEIHNLLCKRYRIGKDIL